MEGKGQSPDSLRLQKKKERKDTMRTYFRTSSHSDSKQYDPNKECCHKYLKNTRSSDCHDDDVGTAMVVVGSDGDGFASHGAGIRATSAKFWSARASRDRGDSLPFEFDSV